jgi:hypothetical protein
VCCLSSFNIFVHGFPYEIISQLSCPTFSGSDKTPPPPPPPYHPVSPLHGTFPFFYALSAQRDTPIGGGGGGWGLGGHLILGEGVIWRVIYRRVTIDGNVEIQIHRKNFIQVRYRSLEMYRGDPIKILCLPFRFLLKGTGLKLKLACMARSSPKEGPRHIF